MMHNPPRLLAALTCCVAGIAAIGCGTPNKANIELRKQNQQLQAQIKTLVKQVEGDQNVIRGLRDRVGTLPTLPTTRLTQLFTTHSIRFGYLTGGADLDPNKPGDEGLAIYVITADESGEKIKAAGTFDIDAFDLAEPKDRLIGHWHLDLQHSRQAWINVLLEYDYAFIIPWQNKVPKHRDVTVKVTFFDELTQTPFTAQKVIHVNLPPQ
jgi:hypothetical protein